MSSSGSGFAPEPPYTHPDNSRCPHGAPWHACNEHQPANPFSEMAESAIAMHEIYVSYVQAGFTRSEALELIALIITRSSGDSGKP